MHAARLQRVQQRREVAREHAQQNFSRFRRGESEVLLRDDGEKLRDAVPEVHALRGLLRRLRGLLRLLRGSLLADLR